MRSQKKSFRALHQLNELAHRPARHLPASCRRCRKSRMERTSIRLGGVALNSTVMNASGPHSAEKGEILELSASHSGAIVFKSCNIAGLESPDNLKNRGVEHFAAIARELNTGSKSIIG